MTINLTVPTTNSSAELKPRISVIGVGGAGGNAVNNMIQMGLEGVEFIVANSDAQALAHSTSERKIQMGAEVTKGLGAGSNPSIGRAAAEESLEEILTHLNDVNMIFVTAGLGGGTGTGAAPVIAKVARDQGILTVGVVTKPFQFEGANRMNIAEAGLDELQQFVDTLLIIPNQNLFRVANEKTTFADAFKMADDVLYSGVRGVTDLMVMPGLINLDFADIKAVMSEMGKAMMGTGEAEGERRAIEAAEAAIANPLLDDTSMSGAKGVLINITAGRDITLFEVDEAANRIRDEVAEDANIIFGSTFEESLEGRVRVSVVATGIESAIGSGAKPTIYQVADFTEEPNAVSASTNVLSAQEEPATILLAEPKSADKVPTLPQVGTDKTPAKHVQQDLVDHVNEAGQLLTELDTEDDNRSSTSDAGAFIPAPAADETASSETMADPFAVADMVNAGTDRQGPKTSRNRGLSLIERVTGVALGERKPERKKPIIPPHPFSAKPSVIPQNLDIQGLIVEPERGPRIGQQLSERVNHAPTEKGSENNSEPFAEGESETMAEPVGNASLESAQESMEAMGEDPPTLLGDGADSHRLTNDDEEDLLDIPAFLRRQAN